MKLRFLLSFFLFLIITGISIAQTGTLRGTVYDAATGEPVMFANVLVKEKGRGTYSDFKGFFSIVVEKGDVTLIR